MRKIVQFSVTFFSALFVIFSVSHPAQSLASSLTEIPVALRSANSTSSKVLPDIREQLQQREYHISENHTGMQAPNRANGFRTYFSKEGIRIEPRINSVKGTLLAMQFAGLGRTAGDVDSLQSARNISYDKNRVSLDHGNGVEEWFVNSELGLEHGFTIEKKPTGEGALRLRLSVADGEVLQAGTSLTVRLADGRRMDYKKLKVVDALKREIQASLIRVDEHTFAISIEDTDALYPLWIDPIITTREEGWFANISFQVGGLLGHSVSAAGDVNGDGYDDVIMGEPGGAGFARVHIYHGSASGLPDGAPDTTLSAPNSPDNDNFGTSVSGAGDVNGDGYDDVIVGAQSTPGGGAVYGYHGSASGISTAVAWEPDIPANSNSFGYYVRSAGDVNGDGYDDVLVGDPGYSNGETEEGAVHIYLGSDSGLATTPATTLEENQADSFYGGSASGAGDLNSDGYDDVIVGAAGYDDGELDEGKAFIYLGSASGLSTTAVRSLQGNEVDAGLGGSVASAGDLNADGYADVVIGAPGSVIDLGGEYESSAYVLFGGDSIASAMTQTVKVVTTHTNGKFGQSVRGAGDVNHDGFDDLAISSGLSVDGGVMLVFLGTKDGVMSTHAWGVSPAQIGQAESIGSLDAAGDVDGDGYDDVIMGIPGWDLSVDMLSEGRVSVIYGAEVGLNPDLTWNETFDAGIGADHFGWAVSDAGDINGDGFDDVLVGAPLYDNGEENEGAVFVYLGSESGLSSYDGAPLEINQAGANFGVSVSALGDINKDGYDDVIVGAHNVSSVFIFLGTASGLSTVADDVLVHNQSGTNFGISVSSGDFNDDGWPDILAGASAYANGESNEGAAFVFLGSDSGYSSTPDSLLEVDSVNARFGSYVSSAGDVNNDGFDDVIVAAPLYVHNSIVQGRAFLFLGPESGVDTTSDWDVPGTRTVFTGSRNVSSAGDFNGDGFGDVLVGTPQTSTGFGHMDVYFGSVSGLSLTPDITEMCGGACGTSVATAGDVNDDGYSDVLMSNHFGGNPVSGEGLVFLYLGNAEETLEFVTLLDDGKFVNGGYGDHVSTAGDVNGDGADDIIIGAPYIESKGKAFVYYGLPKKTWLRGRVVDAADGVTPVYPVVIDLADAVTGDFLGIGVSNNPDGSYEFSDLEPGEYKIFFNAIGAANNYVDELYDEIPCYEGGCDLAALGDTVVLDYGNNTVDVDLEQGAILTGTVVDAADGTTPVHPVFVSFLDPTTGADIGGLVNNPDGTYTSSGVSPGEYKFFFNAFDDANDYIDELYDEVTPCHDGSCNLATQGDTMVLPAGVNNLDEDLDLGVVLSGVLSAAGFGPVGSAGRVLVFQGGQLKQVAFPDSNGNWSMKLPSGPYALFFSTDGSIGPYILTGWDETADGLLCPYFSCDLSALSILVAGNTPITGLDVELTLGIIVSGTVKDAGSMTPLEFEFIVLWDSDGTEKSFFLAMGQTTGEFRSVPIPVQDFYAATSAASLARGISMNSGMTCIA